MKPDRGEGAFTMSLAGALLVYAADYFRSRLVIFMAVVALFVLGVISGAVAVRVVHPATHSELRLVLDEYLAQIGAPAESPGAQAGGGRTLDAVARGAFAPWLLGLSVVGAPVVLGLVFLQGFALGFAVAFLFEALAAKGLLFVFVGVLPHALVGTPGVILAAGAALAFSLSAARLLLGRSREGSVWGQFAAATLLSLVAAVLIAGSSWIQGSVAPILIQTVGGWVSFAPSP